MLDLDLLEVARVERDAHAVLVHGLRRVAHAQPRLSFAVREGLVVDAEEAARRALARMVERPAAEHAGKRGGQDQCHDDPGDALHAPVAALEGEVLGNLEPADLCERHRAMVPDTD